MRKGLAYKDHIKELVVVPEAMEGGIISIAHRQGHLQKSFYISNIATNVGRVGKNCVECIINDAKTGKKEGFLSPIDKENSPLQTYHIDHVEPLLVVVVAFSKCVWLYLVYINMLKKMKESLITHLQEVLCYRLSMCQCKELENKNLLEDCIIKELYLKISRRLI